MAWCPDLGERAHVNAIFDHGLPERCPVDGAQTSHNNIIADNNAANLWNLVRQAVIALGITEAVASQNGARFDDRAVSD